MKPLRIFIFLFAALLAPTVWAQEAGHLVISQTQIAGTSAHDEFVELYNPTAFPIDLEALPLYLHIRNSAGTNFKKTLIFTNKIIPAKGFFLITNTSYIGAVAPDATYTGTSGNLVDNGAVYISTSPTKDIGVIDQVGWGIQPAGGCETACALGGFNPLALNSLTRKPGGALGHGQDTNSNNNDFLDPPDLSNPRNSLSPPTSGAPPPDITPPNEAGNLAAVVGDSKVSLSWTASSSPDLAGYKLYINQGTGFGAGQNLGNVLSATAGSLINNTVYTFKITAYDTVGNESQGVTVQATPQGGAPGPSPVPVAPQTMGTVNSPAFIGAVFINELVPDPQDGEEEWVELFNNSGRTLDITGWTLLDGSKTETKLFGLIPAGNFFVIAKPKGSLNNAGDYLGLKDGLGTLLDQMSYGIWDDGQVEDNAPETRDGYALARFPDGLDRNSDINDFQFTATLTKGEANKITTSQDTGSITLAVFSRAVIINEIFPNPPGDDTEVEFIELKNIGNEPVDVSGWSLGAQNSQFYTIQAKDVIFTVIAPKMFLRIPRSISRLALRNSGGEIVLSHPNEYKTSSVKYGQADEGLAYALNQEGQWAWTSTPTAGQENIFTVFNRPPRAIIETEKAFSGLRGPDRQFVIGDRVVLDASDSYDPDGDEISFAWNLPGQEIFKGARGEIQFKQPGIFKGSVLVSDSSGASDAGVFAFKVLVSAAEIVPLAGAQEVRSSVKPEPEALAVSNSLALSEVMPNPLGSDENEWVEVVNQGGQAVFLKGFILDDEPGGSKPFSITQDISLKPGERRVFYRKDTKLAFNNEGDTARLLAPDNTVASQTQYENAPQGFSWAKDQGNFWAFTSAPTPGKQNIFTPLAQNASLEAGLESSSKIEEPLPLSSPPPDSSFTPVSLGKVRELENKTKVYTSGVVAVEPGVLGKQIFYLAGSGIQVYMNKSDFPTLKLGDQIAVSGTVSESNGEKRLLVAQKKDIEIKSQGEPPEPEAVMIKELSDDLVGSLVVVSGEVTEKKSGQFYLDDDTGEILVYFKDSTSIVLPVFPLGSRLSVTGILSRASSGLRLLPRYESDLEVLESPGPGPRQDTMPKGSEQGSEATNNLWLSLGLAGAALLGLLARFWKEVFKWLKKIFWAGLRRER